MKSAWIAVFDAACGYGIAPPDARRFANLLLSAVLTVESDDNATEEQVRFLMREPHFPIRLRKSQWSSIIGLASKLACGAPRKVDFDGWVREFQLADPSRKHLGAYATPAGFAQALANLAIAPSKSSHALKIVDPSCGAGALLIACLKRLHPTQGPERRSAALILYGMELDPAARELACILIWLAAGAFPEDLALVSANIRCGNALLHKWWEERLYDVVVMNPPWESLRHKASDPEQLRERETTLARINDRQSGAPGLPHLFASQGSGDRNLCKAFIELAPHLLNEHGRIAALLPAAFTSDEGMSALRQMYLDHFRLESWTSFENRAKAFDIDSRYKFGIIVGRRSSDGTRSIGLRAFSVQPGEIAAPHVFVDRERLKVIGGPVGIIPDITSERELDLLTTMLSEGSPFFDNGELGIVQYKREVDLTLGKAKGLFSRLDQRSHNWNDDGTISLGTGNTFVPVLEGRMVGQYDFFQKSWVEGQGRTAVWRENGSAPLASCRPQYIARPTETAHHRIAICDVTSATNTRTVHATIVPEGWVCGNTAPVLRFETEQAMVAGLAILNSLTFDWLARRMVSGLHLNKFYLSCMAWPRLGSEEVGLLAMAGRAMAAIAPRRPIGLEQSTAPSMVQVQSIVEATVARGFGLDANDLAFMLSDDVDDRRGFWRYYASVPESSSTALEASRLLAHA